MAAKALSELMTPAQQEQLTMLLASIVESGFGSLEIVIVKGQVRWFRPQLSLAVCFEDEKDSTANAG